MDNEEKPDKKTIEKWHKDNTYWKWRVFYYNPQDERAFVPKKWGWGWTVNFAKPWPFILILLIATPLLGELAYQILKKFP